MSKYTKVGMIFIKSR